MNWETERFKIWAHTRSVMENDNYKNKRNGVKSRRLWKIFANMLIIFSYFLKVIKVYKKGYDNAMNVKINTIKLEFEDLPEEFENYKILHLSDLHIDTTKYLYKAIIKKIDSIDYDICVMTGDYRVSEYGGFKSIIKPISKLIEHIKTKDGIYGTLGNHDTYLMVDFFEKQGVNILANQHIDIHKGNSKITITGIDDVHCYFTDQAIVALEENINNFKIMLVHSPELYDIAADNNYNLYLCGHTHAGQICFPNGKPLITHLYNGKKYYKGLWKYKNMHGYTSSGCGTSGIPIRFYSNSEITIFELKRK